MSYPNNVISTNSRLSPWAAGLSIHLLSRSICRGSVAVCQRLTARRRRGVHHKFLREASPRARRIDAMGQTSSPSGSLPATPENRVLLHRYGLLVLLKLSKRSPSELFSRSPIFSPSIHKESGREFRRGNNNQYIRTTCNGKKQSIFDCFASGRAGPHSAEASNETMKVRKAP